MNGPIIAVLRGVDSTSPSTSHLIAALAEGGIRTVELAFSASARESWRGTARLIGSLVRRFGGEVEIGAGTVLFAEQVELAAEAGARFMVSPVVDEGIIRLARGRGLEVLPGAFTPTEIARAASAGAGAVKVFPAGAVGPSYIRALSAPLSHVSFWAFGGVTLQSIGAYRSAGCVGVGISSPLLDRVALSRGDFASISATARRFVSAWEGQRI